MSNTITAFFKGRVGVAEAVYQNDYGIVMNLDSIELPAHFDCYFSTLEQDEAIPGIGADGRVAIPNDCLTRAGNVTLHIPIHTGRNDSEVEYIVYFKVIGRARPADDGTPLQMTAIEQALALLQNPIGNIEQIVNEALSFTGETFDEMKAELDADQAEFETGINARQSTVESQVANLVENVKPNTVKTLWTGRLDTDNMSATLSESVSNFDFLDFYTDNGEAHRVPVSRGNIEIKSNNVSDDASLTFFHLGETQYSFSDTTVTLSRATSYINDNVSVKVEADPVYGTIVTRIDGVKVGSSNSAELTDVRVGADGKTYTTAGESVRGQFTNLKSDITYMSGYGEVVFPIRWVGEGYIDRSNGAYHPYAGWKYSDYVEIKGVNPIRFTTDETAQANANNTAFYDASKQYISYFDMRDGDIAVPSNAKYFRVSLANAKTVTATAPLLNMTQLAPKTVLDNFTDLVSRNRLIYDTITHTTIPVSESRTVKGDVYLENGKTYVFRWWYDDEWKPFSTSQLKIGNGDDIEETIFTYTDGIYNYGFAFTWSHTTGKYALTLVSGSAIGYTDTEIANGIVIYDSNKPLTEYEQGYIETAANNALRIDGHSIDELLLGANDYSLIAYGDSLTQGSGASDYSHLYLMVCKTALGAKSALPLGYGGSASKAIAFTAGALSGYVPPNTRSFALKYADMTTNISIALNQLNNKQVEIDGSEYTISQTGNTAYSLPETYTPSDKWLPIVVKNSKFKADIYIIWMGTNDGGIQWDIVDAVIAKLPHKNYVVMGLTRLGTDTSVADELKGYEKYGSHYFNTRMQIINNAFAVLETTPTAEDITAMNNGLMPPSLLTDSTHFNDDGYEAIGKLLAIHIKSLGYDYMKA